MQDEKINTQTQDALVDKHNRRANICLIATILCFLFGICQIITDSFLMAINSDNDILIYLSVFGMPLIAGIFGVFGIVFFAISGAAKYTARRIAGLALSIIGIILDILIFVMIVIMILIGD